MKEPVQYTRHHHRISYFLQDVDQTHAKLQTTCDCKECEELSRRFLEFANSHEALKAKNAELVAAAERAREFVGHMPNGMGERYTKAAEVYDALTAALKDTRLPRPLTAEEAEKALKEIGPKRASDEEIESIVDAVCRDEDTP